MLGGASLATIGCTRRSAEPSMGRSSQTFSWRMVTSWPPGFPAFGTGADRLARAIEENSAGRIRVQVYAAGELVPPFEVFDAVSGGLAEMGHGAPVYWKGKVPAAQLFAGVPFGMNTTELNAWLYHGGGWELWREVYAPFDLLPIPSGNTGVQMGGWFKREIHSMGDLVGLKMRIPGVGGEVLRRVRGVPVNLPGAEIFTALQTGAIDATEWAGPYNDLAWGLHRAAEYYYYPGWHEPSGILECLVNKTAFEALPEDLQSIVLDSCQAMNAIVAAEFTAHNHQALSQLVDQHNVKLRRFPNEVLSGLQAASLATLRELADSDPTVRRVYDAYTTFQSSVSRWQTISERAYLETRQR